MVNPVVYFYEWYLVFYSGLPDSFKALLGLVWGLTIIFFLLNLLAHELS